MMGMGLTVKSGGGIMILGRYRKSITTITIRNQGMRTEDHDEDSHNGDRGQIRFRDRRD